jgi:hypothetical protein
MNDLDMIRQFRSEIPEPDPVRVAGARSRLAAELVAGANARAASVHRAFTPPPARSWRHGRFGAGLAGALGLALVAVALSAGLGGGGAGTADAAIIRHAEAALALPPDRILHVKLEGGGFVAETWQLTSPPYSLLADKGPVGAAPMQEALTGTTAESYDPATDTIRETPITKRAAPSDPLASVRVALAQGRARVLGSAVTDGTPTYEIQFADKGGFDSQSLIAYVDRASYRPVVLSDPQRSGSVVRLRVVAFRYLPVTRENLRALSLTARYPTARVLGGSAGSTSAAAAGSK